MTVRPTIANTMIITTINAMIIASVNAMIIRPTFVYNIIIKIFNNMIITL